ncbi:hypothetical protein L202_00942 [Cryptococcus amylolentus CBS 6039]|uniref:Uncharacterized protein n=1 Tax=Cryptococcus amylolentus CBS 6039 TaxID=1295533 RepID=A0A1E3I232_9TREE|nr:hypothetical protein L202_00942 [Cryptococcus amylolentus CBS 6039]ODN82644.1 hypothetical protein L202_00942 [Cryptococcus amylolentus CBS 6039]
MMKQLGLLFSDSAYEHILSTVFDHLDTIRDMLSAVQVNKQCYHHFQSSSERQLDYLRKKLSFLPDSSITSAAIKSNGTASSTLLSQLQRRHANLANLNASGATLLPFSGNPWSMLAFRDGLLVLSWNGSVEPLNPQQSLGGTSMERAGFQVVRLSRADLDEDSKLRGGIAM